MTTEEAADLLNVSYSWLNLNPWMGSRPFGGADIEVPSRQGESGLSTS